MWRPVLTSSSSWFLFDKLKYSNSHLLLFFLFFNGLHPHVDEFPQLFVSGTSLKGFWFMS
jgi:hypothetical protein